jgi:hypothetical protein
METLSYLLKTANKHVTKKQRTWLHFPLIAVAPIRILNIEHVHQYSNEVQQLIIRKMRPYLACNEPVYLHPNFLHGLLVGFKHDFFPEHNWGANKAPISMSNISSYLALRVRVRFLFRSGEGIYTPLGSHSISSMSYISQNF